MARQAQLKHVRKAGAFTGGELGAGELGLDTTNGVWYYSADGSTVVSLNGLFQPLSSVLTNLTSAWLPANASGASRLSFHEDTDNGSNAISLWGQAALGSDFALVLPGISDTLVARSDAATLTNKDLKSSTNTIEEITTTSSSSTPTPTGGSLRNFFTVTALATNPTFAAPSGTPANGHQLLIRIKDNGTGRTLAWNAIYRSVAATLPTSTTANKTSYVGFKYNSADSKWDCIAYGQEP